MKPPNEITPDSIKQFLHNWSYGTEDEIRDMSYALLFEVYTDYWIRDLEKKDKK